jgi:hypothetical protein
LGCQFRRGLARVQAPEPDLFGPSPQRRIGLPTMPWRFAYARARKEKPWGTKELPARHRSHISVINQEVRAEHPRPKRGASAGSVKSSPARRSERSSQLPQTARVKTI